MTKMKALNLRKRKYLIKKRIYLKNLILDQRNLPVRSQRARGVGGKKNESVPGTGIIELIADLGVVRGGDAMTFSHLQR